MSSLRICWQLSLGREVGLEMERLDPEPGVSRISPVLRLGVGSSPKVLSQKP